jgi:hypothetical protein
MGSSSYISIDICPGFRILVYTIVNSFWISQYATTLTPHRACQTLISDHVTNKYTTVLCKLIEVIHTGVYTSIWSSLL